jgi:(E)-4-hydroxy-3-methylbut-2-enyl-diphosphate synthase
MVRAALRFCEDFESWGFRDIKLSLKASGVLETIAAYRAVAAACDYPLHVGVTAAGAGEAAVVKSAVGIGSLLADGIGDTLRVSLTGPPDDEVRVGYEILEAVGLRRRHAEIISCPTCGRCQIDLPAVVSEVERRISARNCGLKVAIMGCVVNGPGEAREADVGIAGGRGFGYLFRHGRKLRRVPADRLADELVAEVEKLSRD